MKKHVVSLLVIGAAVVTAAPAVGAAPACQPGQTPGAAPLYCVPASTPETATAASRGTSKALSKLKLSQLQAKQRVSLPVVFAAPGTLTVTVSARLGGRTVVIGRATATSTNAGAATVKLVLSKAGRAALKQHQGALTLSVSATFKPADGGVTTKATSKTKLR
ncbi:MAG TPA: hypothetical protein VLJ42_07465 [Solirubrobacteraceae bacterium]|nr:hypothetical protein [Solirubrobacteraceae bacterium]